MGSSAIGSMNIVLSANAASFSQGIQQAQAQLNKFRRASQQAGHGTVSSMQAASAAIRTLEGGFTGNIRAAERFIGTIPGVGKALQAAFPLVGALAFGGAIAKVGIEFADMVQKANKAPQAIANSFREMNLAGLTANDTMAVTNDRLANEIAKLQGKPQNNLALAIDEARVAADKLASSLDADNTKTAALLERNRISAVHGFATGRAGTADVEGSINSYDQKMSDLGYQYNTAVHSGDSAAAARLQKALDDTRQSAINWVTQRIEATKAQAGLPGGLNQDANLNVLYGYRTTLTQSQGREAGEARNAQLTAQKAQLDGAKAAAEANKQAQELLIQQWREALEQDKALSLISLDQEATYWAYRAETATKGSLSYRKAIDEANTAIAAINRQSIDLQKETQKKSDAFDQTAGNVGVDRFDLSRDSAPERQSGNDSVAYLRTLNEGIAAQRANANALEQARLQMAETTGQISRLDAAQQLAALHTREYRQQIDALEAALRNIAADTGLTAVERATATAGINNQIGQARSQYQIQSQQDQQAINGQQIGPAIRQSLDEMVQAWKDMAGEIAATLGRTVNGLNDNIVKSLTGQKTNYGATFLQAGQGLLKAGLQRGESALLGSFGLGKADGSSEANALWVRMSSGVASAAGGLGGLISKIPGMQFIQPFIQGHFAGGGDLMAGYPAIVGERGPELFMPRSSGSIIPNSQLAGMGGTTHTYVIDARGSNDPAAIEAAVRRAMPQAVAAATQVQHERARRMPRGR